MGKKQSKQNEPTEDPLNSRLREAIKKWWAEQRQDMTPSCRALRNHLEVTFKQDLRHKKSYLKDFLLWLVQQPKSPTRRLTFDDRSDEGDELEERSEDKSERSL